MKDFENVISQYCTKKQGTIASHEKEYWVWDGYIIRDGIKIKSRIQQINIRSPREQIMNMEKE